MCCQRYSRSSWLTALLPCPAHACSTMKIAVALAICLLLVTEASCRRTLAGDDTTPRHYPTTPQDTTLTWPHKPTSQPTGKAGPTSAAIWDYWTYGNYCGSINGCSRTQNMLPCTARTWFGMCVAGPRVDYPDCWSAPPVDALDAACRQHDSCLTFSPSLTEIQQLCHRNLAVQACRWARSSRAARTVCIAMCFLSPFGTPGC